MPDSAGGHPEGAAPLSAAIAALRDELMHAFWAGQFTYDVGGQQRTLRFKPAPVELTLQVAVTWGGRAEAGVQWWLISAGGELSRQSVTTQTLKLSLEPQMFDEQGAPVEFLIDTADSPDTETPAQTRLLDAPG